MVAVPVKKDLLGALGQSADVIGQQVGQLSERPLDKLKSLGSAYAVPAASLGKFGAAADRTSDLAPFMHNPTPVQTANVRGAHVEGGYYRRSVSPHSTANDPFPALLDRFTRRGQVLAMSIRKREDVRTTIERKAVGKVLPDGRNDATVTIQTTPPPSTQTAVSGISTVQMESMAQAVPDDVMRQFMNIQMATIAFGPFGVVSNAMDGGGFVDSLGIGRSNPFDSTSSLDAGILRLKRMIDKRTQGMEIYSNSMTQYNTSAKSIIDKLRA